MSNEEGFSKELSERLKGMLNCNHANIGYELGEFVDEKNKAYQNSFEKVGRIIDIVCEDLNGEELRRALPIVVFTGRLLDKIIRKVRNCGKGGDMMGEDPLWDLAGYVLLQIKSEISESNNGNSNKEESGSSKDEGEAEDEEDDSTFCIPQRQHGRESKQECIKS